MEFCNVNNCVHFTVTLRQKFEKKTGKTSSLNKIKRKSEKLARKKEEKRRKNQSLRN